jgi:uncharacterized protein (DUF1501 family)
MKKTSASRRHFLQTATACSALGAAGPLALNMALMSAASAATATDYKALICLFMSGGNDSFNTLVATDPDSWREYKRWRDAGSVPLSLPAVGQPGGLIGISPSTPQSGRSFALHPRLVNIAAQFNNKRLAFISNVGPTLGQMDPRNFSAGVAPFLPNALFSHNDQQVVWQSGQTEGASVGWGGRMGDLLASANGSEAIFTNISTLGGTVFLSGRDVIQYTTDRSVGTEIEAINTGVFGSTQSQTIMRRIITRDSQHLFEKEAAAITRRSISASAALKGAALPLGPTGVANPTLVYNPFFKQDVENTLAVQMQTVARVIGGSAGLGLKRQVFFVGLGGFDSHSTQMPDHDYRMTLVDHAMGYLDGALANLGGRDVRNQVTLFSASDFGRTFSSNGDGTDHGYGAHHFMYGGAVKGGDIFGTFPASGLGHLWDYGKGVLLPQYAVDQYGATLAKWLGVADSSIADVFPNIARFSQRDLGFMMA